MRALRARQEEGRRRGALAASAWMAALLFVAAGCRNLTLPDGTLVCSADHTCPSPYVCSPANNKCYRSLSDGGAGGTGGASDAGAGGRADAGGGAGGRADAGVGGHVDAPQDNGDGMGAGGTGAGIATGLACQTDSDCTSAACRDGVCCADTCTGACRACSLTYTGLPNGTCGPANSGIDPHDDCADQTATNRCGQDGQCDGLGQCRKVQSGQSCSDATCNAETFVSAGQCDGAGTCQPGTSMDCGAYPCATTGCAKPCTGDSSCPSGTYCSNGTCKTQKLGGVACAANDECALGFCSPDMVCCNAVCTGSCMACTKVSTGQPDGTCAAVQLGLDPNNDCATSVASTCGLDGTCDGKGACHFYDSSTSCGASSCSGSTYTPGKSCNAAGACVAGGTPMNCGGAACASDGCKTTCTADTDCAMGSFCVMGTGTCAAKKANGAGCTNADECTYNACVDGVCCESACTALCYACSNAKTGATSGSCLPIATGTDPDNECASSAQTTCGQDGTCDGTGQCRLWMDGTQCGPSSCNSGGNFVAQSTCSQGTCRTPSPAVCGSEACDPTNGCKHNCASNQDCVGATYCNLATTTCAAQKTPGTTCGSGAECLSTYCVDGVCCNAACNGTCVSCVAKDNGLTADGTCGNVKDGTDPANECSPGTTTCGLDGTCGGGKCRFAPTSVSCAGATCANNATSTTTTFTAAETCNGSGTCPTATPGPCPGNVLCASTTACKSATCATSSDCITGDYCASGTCTPKRGLGGACSGTSPGGQCTSGFCSPDGVCCNSACTLACQACTMASTGVGSGTCAPKLPAAGTLDVPNCGGTCAAGYGLCTNISAPANPVCDPLSWGFENGAPSAWQSTDSFGSVSFYQTVGTMGAKARTGLYAIGSFGADDSTDWELNLATRLCASNTNVGVDVHGKTFNLYYYASTPKPTPSADVSMPTCTFTYTGWDTSGFGFDSDPFTMTITGFNAWTLFSYQIPQAVVYVNGMNFNCTFGTWLGPFGFNGATDVGVLYFDDISFN